MANLKLADFAWTALHVRDVSERHDETSQPVMANPKLPDCECEPSPSPRPYTVKEVDPVDGRFTRGNGGVNNLDTTVS